MAFPYLVEKTTWEKTNRMVKVEKENATYGCTSTWLFHIRRKKPHGKNQPIGEKYRHIEEQCMMDERQTPSECAPLSGVETQTKPPLPALITPPEVAKHAKSATLD